METNVFETRKFTFVTPSGHNVTIREQNGADDDILSNPASASTGMNISQFLASIITSCDYIEGKTKITAEEAQLIPSLDRYCILFNSRIFSLGETMEFTFDWGQDGGQVNYEQDLRDFIFDYSQIPTEEELNAKPNAIPFYPNGGQATDLTFTTTSGKELKFDLLNAKGEAYIMNLPLEKQTKNQVFVARNLQVKIGEKYEKVHNFSIFSTKDMIEIRNYVLANDPVFMGNTDIENPVTNQKQTISIVAIKDFFYPGEI